jgi:hypothetical protein
MRPQKRIFGRTVGLGLEKVRLCFENKFDLLTYFATKSSFLSTVKAAKSAVICECFIMSR